MSTWSPFPGLYLFLTRQMLHTVSAALRLITTVKPFFYIAPFKTLSKFSTCKLPDLSSERQVLCPGTPTMNNREKG